MASFPLVLIWLNENAPNTSAYALIKKKGSQDCSRTYEESGHVSYLKSWSEETPLFEGVLDLKGGPVHAWFNIKEL